ncbi:MAG: hypothetical protein J6K18_06270 [Bacilli bacterium]|nr:hypothetical protein [Bacilli bacterium]
MDTIQIGLVFTILGGIIGYATFYMNSKKNTKQETKEETTVITSIGTKLDLISKNVDEIRLDNKDFNKSMHQLGERISAVEQSTKSAHHRIDSLEELHRK